MSTTEDRIESLENQLRDQQSQVRRQRRWNIALGGVLLLSGCIATTNSQSVPDVIQAKKFEVVNDEGKVIVLMESVFSKGEHYGFVKTQNGKGQTLVKLGVTTDGEGVVETQNGKGGTLVALTASDGGGFVATQNGKGQALVELGSSPMGGKILVSNTVGKGVLGMGGNPEDGSGVIVTFDSAGEEITSTTPSP
jgi:hypothetical protein